MPIYIPNTFDSVGEAVVDGATGGGGFILDQVTGATFAVSSRKLSASYAGAALRVRRASDNAQQDIGFDANDNLDTAALTAFCTGTDGFIHSWYNQAAANHATQTTLVSQPKVYDSVTGVILRNLRPAITWDGIDDFLPTTINFFSDFTAFWVSAPTSGFSNVVFGRGNGSGRFVVGMTSTTPASSNVFFYKGGAVSTNIFAEAKQYIGYALNKSSSTLCRVGYNGQTGLPASPIGTDNLEILTLGAERSGFTAYANVAIQEVIIYSSDKSANRALVEENMNAYFQTYIPYTYDLQEFSTTGTWTKPANCLLAEVVIIGAGGGGASGSKRSSGSTSQGGSAGAGGSVIYNTFLGSSLGATESVTIGVAGNGGAAVTQNNTNGTTGGIGGMSFFGNYCALPGAGAASYNTAGVPLFAWDLGVARNGAGFVNGAGGRISSVAGSGDGVAGGTQTFLVTLQAAPSGGSIASASTGAGAAGNRLYDTFVALNTPASAKAINTGIKGDNGIANYSANASVGPLMWATGNLGTMHYGTSGAGGSASINPTNGGDAGDSGNYGQGGAGGGACQDGGGIVSGKGGNAGGACIKILSICAAS